MFAAGEVAFEHATIRPKRVDDFRLADLAHAHGAGLFKDLVMG